MAKKDFTAKLTNERQSIVKEMLENAEQTALDLPKGTAPAANTTKERKEPGKGTRSKRVQILVTQETFNELVAISTMERESVNEVINKAIAEHISQHKETIKQFNMIFKKEQ